MRPVRPTRRAAALLLPLACAPLELWLMGLLPAEEVPPVPMLVDAAPDPEGLARLQQHARRFAGVELAPCCAFCRATRGRATIRADL